MKHQLLVVVLFFVVVGLLIENVEAKKRKHFLIPTPKAINHCTSLPAIAVYFALDAYRDLSKGESTRHKSCDERFEMVSNLDGLGFTKMFRARIFYSAKDKLAVFTIQGTNPTSWSDWMNNFSYSLASCIQDFSGKTGLSVDCDGGKFHEGFLKEWAYARIYALNALKTFLSNAEVTRLVITGHSKGAALSYIAAADIKAQLADWKLKPTPKLYNINFGSPRPGDKAFSDWYLSLQIPTKRYSISVDPVTMIPLSIMGFSHVGGDDSAIALRCPLSNLIFFCHEGYQGVVDVGTSAPTPLVTDKKKRRKKRHYQSE